MSKALLEEARASINKHTSLPSDVPDSTGEGRVSEQRKSLCWETPWDVAVVQEEYNLGGGQR